MNDAQKKNIGCWMLLIVFVILPIAVSRFGPFIKSNTFSASNHDAGMACTMAEKLIKPQLKAPKTAEFDYADCKGSAIHSGNTWTLTTYVDSDNSIGAHIRTHFVAKLTNVPPSDQWRLDSAIFDNP
jgi:hypothetical protein